MSSRAIVAAALGALAARNRYTRRAPMLRGPRRTMTRYRSRYLATRYRPRRRRLSKRRWQARARKYVGPPRNYANAKTDVSKAAAVSVPKNCQQLHITPCIAIQSGTDINQRMRNTVNLSGIRIQFACRNISNSPIFLNWAVICARNNGVSNLLQTQSEFFRDYNSTRAWNANDSSKFGLEWSNASINPDMFHVLRRGKFLLAGYPSSTSYTYNVKDSHKEMDIYVKIGRQVNFQDDSDVTGLPIEQVWFVYWGATPLSAAGYATSNQFSEITKVIQYYREPKTG